MAMIYPVFEFNVSCDNLVSEDDARDFFKAVSDFIEEEAASRGFIQVRKEVIEELLDLDDFDEEDGEEDDEETL